MTSASSVLLMKVYYKKITLQAVFWEVGRGVFGGQLYFFCLFFFLLLFLEVHILDVGIAEMYQLQTETSRKVFYVRCLEQAE